MSVTVRIPILVILVCAGLGLAKTPKPRQAAQTVGHGVVWRISDRKDHSGNALPPWKEIKITNVFGIKTKPVIGTTATVVPIDVDIPPFDLRISNAKVQQGCGDGEPKDWDVTLESPTEKSLFTQSPITGRSEQYPFDVAVIYPAVSFAQQLEMGQLTRAMLPRQVALSTVKAAIDLNRDQRPDILKVEYCCDGQSAKECDYTCGKTFKRFGKTWKLMDQWSPC